MSEFPITDIKHAITAASLLVLLAAPLPSALADDRDPSATDHWRAQSPDRKVKRIRGVAVTGVNSILGKPFFSWGEPFGASFNFPTMGALNRSGPQPLPLNENTPQSSILVSWIDRTFLALFNKPPDYVLNPAWLNVPLRDVPVNVDFAFMQTAPLRGVREAEPLELAQAEPANDITLGQWLQASGAATIECAGEGANIKLRMSRLIPNRMYTVWATMGAPTPPGSPAPNAFPIPLGGAPNTFMTDENGDGTFKRWVKFCPLDPQSGGSPLLFIDVQFNSKHQTYGAVVAPGFIDGNWPGLITFSHVVFPVNVELLDH
jgi:hypothetical protein